MGRDALFVDIGPDLKILRLSNTHLESLVAQPPLRPAQVALASRHLHAVHAGVIAGDFNAIESFDRTLHTKNDLKDAFLVTLTGEEGWTWGMQSGQAQRKRYGCSRLDKILFCGGVQVRGLERIGAGLKIEEEGGAFVSDHLGLMADLVVE